MTAQELWDWPALIAAADGRGDGQPSRPVVGFSLDTRSLLPGEVFVALKDQRDGHQFVTAAFQRGAAGALVDESYVRQADDGALIRVGCTLRGLENIGRAARARLDAAARVIAVTGSVGKTGTKEMLRACLSRLGATHAPEKSFNNHWGVPLTLARMPRDTQYGVLEIGMNHAGEITPLSKMVRPHVAIVTTVEAVHLENFQSVAGIADAKAEIFLGLEPGGTAIINRDNVWCDRLAEAAEAAGARVASFGRAPGADIVPTVFDAVATHSDIRVQLGQLEIAFRVGAPGVHLATNALAVAAALHVLGVDVATALAALSVMPAPQGRGRREVLDIGGGTALLIDESYNANPASMRAAFDAVALVPRAAYTRRIAVLGDMLELGPQSGEMHAGLAEFIDRADIDLVFAAGSDMRMLFDALPARRRGGFAANAGELADEVCRRVHAGDVIVVKGSFGSRMGGIVEVLQRLYGRASGGRRPDQSK